MSALVYVHIRVGYYELYTSFASCVTAPSSWESSTLQTSIPSETSLHDRVTSPSWKSPTPGQAAVMEASGATCKPVAE